MLFAAEAVVGEPFRATGWFLENAWIIPIIPAVGFFVILLLGKRLPGKGAEVGIASMAASLVLSLGAAYQWIQAVRDAKHGSEALIGALGRSLVGRAEAGEAATYVLPVIKQWTWWQAGGFEFTFGQHIDGLALTLLTLVSFISLLVQIYSTEYVKGDVRYTHFFAALTLFAAGMLTMVSAEGMVQFLLGWEIMGLCSFLLIGHWWEEYANARAALKAFFTVRVGDAGLLVGIAILFFASNDWINENFPGTGGGFSIQGLSAWALSGEGSSLVLTTAAVAMFIAVIGKSGQFPLHTWLPDAMAGPTPVSSLLHSSTMVVAGVFLVARLYPVFWEGMNITGSGINLIVVIGAITIVIAAALAFVQTDIKKVLAYSTVSQLGYMIMGLGAGAWLPAVFHIFTHAFFKACLFLGAGSVSHSGSHHSFDMKKDMGGLRKYMPVTHATFLISTLALAGIWPLAGFWSKDEILAYAGKNGYTLFMVVGLVGAFMTAAYMTRCMYLTFWGAERGPHTRAAHEPEPVAVAAVAGDDHGLGHGGGHGAGHGGAHGGAHGHGHDHHAGPPHESPRTITVPLVILAACAVFAGLLQTPGMWPVKTELFKEWVEPGAVIVPVDSAQPGGGAAFAVAKVSEPGRSVRLPAAEGGAGEEAGSGHGGAPAPGQAQFFPALSHPPFSVPKALLSVAIALAGIGIGLLACRAVYERNLAAGLTRRNGLVGAGYRFLANKYYLDDLYEKVVVAGISGPIARAANWFNQRVLDGVVNAVGVGGKEAGVWLYKNIDQAVVDGAVNGAGAVAEGSGGLLRTLQTGRVSQYGALLFGATAVGALVLVLVV